MKRKTIASLEAELKETKESEARLLDLVLTARRKLAEILEIGEVRYGSRHEVSWDDIYLKASNIVGKLEGMRLKEGEVMPWIHEEQNQTNAKLWYLLRVALEDDTLENEKANYENFSKGSYTPFDKPRF